MELYRSANGSYPNTQDNASSNCWVRSNNTTIANGVEDAQCAPSGTGNTPTWGLLTTALTPYMAKMPEDSLNKNIGGNNYFLCYQATATDYKLQAQLEQNKNIMETDGGNTDNRYEIFTNGAKLWGN